MNSAPMALLLASLLLTATNSQDVSCNIRSICFALDQSHSIDFDEYDQIKSFTIEAARKILASDPTTLFSSYGFSYEADEIQTSTNDVEGTFIPAIMSSGRGLRYTNIHAGVSACFDEVRPAGGNRVIVLLTDGEQTRGGPPARIVPHIRAAGVSLVSVGVGGKTDVANLKAMATRPDFFVPTTFDSLPGDASVVVQKTCEVVKVTPDPTGPVSPPAVQGGCGDAYEGCDWGFKGVSGVPTYDMDGQGDRSFTPRIVSKGDVVIGVVNTNHIVPEFIAEDGSAHNITMFGDQAFTPTAFKPFALKSGTHSGVGHEVWQGDQSVVVRDRCVRIYFSHYQILDKPRGHVVGNINAEKEDNKCVVFKTAA